MKPIVLLISFSLLTCQGVLSQGIQLGLSQPAQLIARAGNDTLVCSGRSVTLGANPTATGGYNNYVFLWSPPDGLNDPTSANPTATLTTSKTYMVSVTDGNGCTAVSFVNVRIDPCLGTDPRSLNGEIRVFPNPTGGPFTISCDPGAGEFLESVVLLNRLGQVVYSKDYRQAVTEDLSIDAGLTEKGVYFLRIRFSDRLVSQRLVIQ